MLYFSENLLTPGNVLQNIFIISLMMWLFFLFVRCELARFRFEHCKL